MFMCSLRERCAPVTEVARLFKVALRRLCLRAYCLFHETLTHIQAISCEQSPSRLATSSSNNMVSLP